MSKSFGLSDAQIASLQCLLKATRTPGSDVAFTMFNQQIVVGKGKTLSRDVENIQFDIGINAYSGSVHIHGRIKSVQFVDELGHWKLD